MSAAHGDRMMGDRTLVRMSRCALLVACVVACGDQHGVTVTPSGGQVSTELHAGDYVVYRFSGSFSEKPVTLREQVVSRESGRVTIDVHATRGREERRWIQVGPDTADARWNNTVDEIYVVRDDGTRERLPNPDNATLMRLYDWVLVPAEGDSTDHESAACDQPIATTRVACVCERATHGSIHTELSRCAGFAWQRGPGRFSSASGVVWQVEVLEAR
jgi:hypothetical protein